MNILIEFDDHSCTIKVAEVEIEYGEILGETNVATITCSPEKYALAKTFYRELLK